MELASLLFNNNILSFPIYLFFFSMSHGIHEYAITGFIHSSDFHPPLIYDD